MEDRIALFEGRLDGRPRDYSGLYNFGGRPTWLHIMYEAERRKAERAGLTPPAPPPQRWEDLSAAQRAIFRHTYGKTWLDLMLEARASHPVDAEGR